MSVETKKPGPPTVKNATVWPCEGGATVGEIVECPGTTPDNHPCKKLLQIRAGTNADKPSFGKYFVMHPQDDGGCGYFSYCTFTEGDTEIGLQEPVYRRAKRRIVTSVVPNEDINPTKRMKPDHIVDPTTTEKIKALETSVTLLKEDVKDIWTGMKGVQEEIQEFCKCFDLFKKEFEQLKELAKPKPATLSLDPL